MEYFKEGATWGLIPAHMREGLRLYIMEGVPGGGFMTSVLSNDLKDACGKADHENRRALFEWVQFLYNDAPAICWGSRERVEAWIDAGGCNGLAARQSPA